MQMILASASVGRKHILALLKIPFTVLPSKIDENSIIGKTAADTLILRARAKAEAIVHQLEAHTLPVKDRHYLMIAADSSGVLADKLYGKPRDVKEARLMLSQLAGRAHVFITALICHRVDFSRGDSPKITRTWEKVEKTQVTLAPLSRADINRYLAIARYKYFATGISLLESPQDFVIQVKGSLSNVIGLPLEQLIPILRENKLVG